MPRSPLAWRSGGAESVCERIWRFIARIGFDSPHLHQSPPLTAIPTLSHAFGYRVGTASELPPVSWTSKLKSREWEAFRACGCMCEA